MSTIVRPPSSYKHPEQHLRTLLTHPWYKVLDKIYSTIFESTYDFYKSQNIQPILFPITTGSISSPMGLGSDSLPVKCNIRGNDVYLADSMQFCLEIGARLNELGAYYIMPTFRGEATDKRHLNEFIHSEVEIKGDLDDVMALAEAYIKYMVQSLLDSCRDEILQVAGTIKHLEAVLDTPFPRIRFEDAIDELVNIPDAYKVRAGGVIDITQTGEQALIQKYGHFVWLTHLPWMLVPFYQRQDPSNPEYSQSADLLAGIGEILGSGERTCSGTDLDRSLKAHGVDADAYDWYREMHSQYTVQTSGFGLGIERFILWLTKHDDIRDCTLLLRDHDKVITP